MSTCPVCLLDSTQDEWYEISNDYHALCPKCDNVVQYKELEEANKL